MGYEIWPVKTIEDIRHANLKKLIAGFRTIQAFADTIDRSHSQVSQWKNRSVRHRKTKIEDKAPLVSNVDSDSARHIESKLKKPLGWMDQDHDRIPEEYVPLIMKFQRIADAEKRQRVLSLVLSVVQEAVGETPSPEPTREHAEDRQTQTEPDPARP